MVFASILGRVFFLPFLFLKYIFARRVHDEIGEAIPLTAPRRLRFALEDLGGIFIKFGELLAMRFDVLPLPYAVQLLNIRQSGSRRTDERASEKLFAVFREELGKNIGDVFESVEERPILVSLFYQTYRAKLAGNDVVIKIQKPGVRIRARADLIVLRFLAAILDDVGIFRRVALFDLIRQLEEWLADELDCAVEASNSRTLYDHAQKHHDAPLVIPIIYTDFTRKRVLVREYLSGIRLDKLIARSDSFLDDVRQTLITNNINLADVARNLLRDMMRQYFVEGFFLLNPYPSTILLLPNNQFSYTEFGIIGRAAYPTEPFRAFFAAAENLEFAEAAEALVNFAEAHTCKPFQRLLDEDERYRKIFERTTEILKERLTADITPILNAWHALADHRGGGTASASAAAFVSILKTLHFYKLAVPPDAVAFLRALLMLELIGSHLSPTFTLVDSIRDFIVHSPSTGAYAALPAPEEIPAEPIAPINEFETLHTIDVAPEVESETAIRASERKAVAQEKFDAWITVLVERIPDLYNEIKYI